MTCSEWLTAFLDDLSYRRSGSSLTRKSYQHDIEVYFQWLDDTPEAKVVAASAYDLQRFFTAQTKSGLSARTVSRGRAAVSSFYRFLLRRGIVESNPTKPTKVARPDKSLPKAISEAPLNRTMDELSPTLTHRDRWILEGLYGTGLRVSEFVSLRLSDLRPAEQRLEVIGKGGKKRSVPLSQSAWEALESYLIERGLLTHAGIASGHILTGKTNKPITARTVQRHVAALLGGLRSGMPVTPHQLRHSYASHLLSGGAELRAVQELLGHTRLATTQIYTHLDPGPLRELVRKLHPRGGSVTKEEK